MMPSPSQSTTVQPDPPVARRRPKVWWNTRQIALDQNDRDLYVKLSIRELLIYVVFLVIYLIFCSGMYSYTTYGVNREVSSLFVNSIFVTSSDEDASSIKFDDIITTQHFWKYFHIVLCEKFYEIPIGIGTENGSQILYENKFLFRPRARQVRIEKGHCKIRNQFKGLFQDCYVPYDEKYEDRSSFGPKKGTQWKYSGESITQALTYDGQITRYGTGGYYFDFPKDKTKAKLLIKYLKQNAWLDRATRAVFVDFVIYNGNINTICVAKYT